MPLLEYLIHTYSNEQDIVLDNCMESGSTGVACVNTNYHFCIFHTCSFLLRNAKLYQYLLHFVLRYFHLQNNVLKHFYLVAKNKFHFPVLYQEIRCNGWILKREYQKVKRKKGQKKWFTIIWMTICLVLTVVIFFAAHFHTNTIIISAFFIPVAFCSAMPSWTRYCSW